MKDDVELDNSFYKGRATKSTKIVPISFVAECGNKQKMCLTPECVDPDADFGFLQLANSSASLLHCSLALFFNSFFLHQRDILEGAALAVLITTCKADKSKGNSNNADHGWGI